MNRTMFYLCEYSQTYILSCHPRTGIATTRLCRVWLASSLISIMERVKCTLEEIEQLITEYETCPMLWDLLSLDYRNRIKKKGRSMEITSRRDGQGSCRNSKESA